MSGPHEQLDEDGYLIPNHPESKVSRDEPIYEEIGPPSSSQGQGNTEYRPALPPRNVRQSSLTQPQPHVPRKRMGRFERTMKPFQRRQTRSQFIAGKSPQSRLGQFMGGTKKLFKKKPFKGIGKLMRRTPNDQSNTVDQGSSINNDIRPYNPARLRPGSIRQFESQLSAESTYDKRRPLPTESSDQDYMDMSRRKYDEGQYMMPGHLVPQFKGQGFASGPGSVSEEGSPSTLSQPNDPRKKSKVGKFFRNLKTDTRRAFKKPKGIKYMPKQHQNEQSFANQSVVSPDIPRLDQEPNYNEYMDMPVYNPAHRESRPIRRIESQSSDQGYMDMSRPRQHDEGEYVMPDQDSFGWPDSEFDDSSDNIYDELIFRDPPKTHQISSSSSSPHYKNIGPGSSSPHYENIGPGSFSPHYENIGPGSSSPHYENIRPGSSSFHHRKAPLIYPDPNAQKFYSDHAIQQPDAQGPISNGEEVPSQQGARRNVGKFFSRTKRLFTPMHKRKKYKVN